MKLFFLTGRGESMKQQMFEFVSRPRISAALSLLVVFLSLVPKCLADESDNSADLASDRVYYGVEVAPQNFPISYLEVFYSPTQVVACTGVVIDSKTILTAAHCLDDGQVYGIRVIAGGQVLAYGKLYGIHPYYIPLGFLGSWFDLGFIKLDRKLPRSVKVASIAKKDPLPGELLTILGYGLDEFGIYNILKAGIMQVTGSNGINTVAARPPGGGTACHGDSGGPAFIVQRKKLVVAGITSYGGPTCTADWISFASLVHPASKWFIKVAKRAR